MRRPPDDARRPRGTGRRRGRSPASAAALLVAAAAALSPSAANARRGPVLELPQLAPAIVAPFLLGDEARPRRLRADAAWWGGPTTSSTGEFVRINVSTSYPVDEAVARGWADLFASLAHGPELTLAEVYVAPAPEIEEICGSRALGCYGGNELFTLGDSGVGVPPAMVAAHEYGHHLAAHRLNPPWRALSWGPKHWATAADICRRAARGTVFPADDGTRYALDPAEGFAEAYRVFNERRRGSGATDWPIVDPSFFPDDRALAAIEADALRPWAAPTRGRAAGRFTARGPKRWRRQIETPLDGELEVVVRLGAGATHRVALVRPDGSLAGRGLWSGSQERTVRVTVCGERRLELRVVREGAAGGFAARWSRP